MAKWYALNNRAYFEWSIKAQSPYNTAWDLVFNKEPHIRINELHSRFLNVISSSFLAELTDCFHLGYRQKPQGPPVIFFTSETMRRLFLVK